jgi:hypothetical protein
MSDSRIGASAFRFDTALLILIVLDRETIAVTGAVRARGGRGDTGMRVGVCMPTAMPLELERSFFLDWVIDLEDVYFSIIGWAQSPIAGQPMWCAQQKPPAMYPLPSIKVSGAAHGSAVA